MARDLEMLLDSLITAVEHAAYANAMLNEYEGTPRESRLRATIEQNDKLKEEYKAEILASYTAK